MSDEKNYDTPDLAPVTIELDTIDQMSLVISLPLLVRKHVDALMRRAQQARRNGQSVTYAVQELDTLVVVFGCAVDYVTKSVKAMPDDVITKTSRAAKLHGSVPNLIEHLAREHEASK